MDVLPVDWAVDIIVEDFVITGESTDCVVVVGAAVAVVGAGEDVIVEALTAKLVAEDIVDEDCVVIRVVTERVVVVGSAVEVVDVEGFDEDVVVVVGLEVVIQVVFCACAGQFMSTFAELIEAT